MWLWEINEMVFLSYLPWNLECNRYQVNIEYLLTSYKLKVWSRGRDRDRWIGKKLWLYLCCTRVLSLLYRGSVQRINTEDNGRRWKAGRIYAWGDRVALHGCKRIRKFFLSFIYSFIQQRLCCASREHEGLICLLGRAEFPTETTARQESKQNVQERVRMPSWKGSKVNEKSRRLE